MRIANWLTMVAILVFAASTASAATYSETLGTEKIRTILQGELEWVSELAFSEEAVDFIVNAAARVESSEDEETAVSDLRDGFETFLAAFVDYARERSLNYVGEQQVAVFLRTAAKCGMIPCSPECCKRCEPC